MKRQALSNKCGRRTDGHPALTAKQTALHGAAMIAVFAFCLPCKGAETIRWVDSEGVVHYTDKLPPEEAVRPHAKLGPEARIKELFEGQKTREQLEQLKRLRQLRNDQQRILAEQRDSDLALQRTYHSEEEMQVALQGKLNTMDSARKVADSNRQHQEEILRSQVQRAAEIELSGQAVPQNLRDSIETTRKQIAMYQEKNRSLENAKTETIAAFSKDMERFKRLQELRLNPELGSLEWRSQNPAADVGILSAISCREKQCNAAWALAKDYLRSKTGKAMVTETETILQTAAPREERDIAMLVVRVRAKTQDTVFLDTACHLSSIGDELCASDSIREIRAGFVPFIEQGLKAAGR